MPRKAHPVCVSRLGAEFRHIVGERFDMPTLSAGAEMLGVWDKSMRLAGAAVFFDLFPQRTVEMGIATWRAGAITPSAMAHVMAYPFGQLGVVAVLCRCRADAPEVVRLMRGMGFFIRAVPHLYGETDGYMGALTLDAWQGSRLYREI